MSSFMVSDKTIDNVLSGLKNAIGMNHRGMLNDYELFTDKEFTAYGQAMLALNDYALAQRYSQHELTGCAHYRFTDRLVSLEQAVSDINCWAYQCSEGDAMERKTFERLQEIKKALCVILVEQSDKYKSATWGG